MAELRNSDKHRTSAYIRVLFTTQKLLHKHTVLIPVNSIKKNVMQLFPAKTRKKIPQIVVFLIYSLLSGFSQLL